MEQNELMHHGVHGQKWGVRRYQNKDGSLTLAGKKRALRIQNDYTELQNNKKYRDRNGNMTYAGRKKSLKLQNEYATVTGKKHLIAFNNKTDKSKKNGKDIGEMTNQELQAKVDRLRLEQQLKQLSPAQKTVGQKFLEFAKDTSVSIAKDKGTRILGDYMDKQIRDAIGLNKKEPLTESQKLAQKAKDATNRKLIAQAEDYLNEREKKSSQSSSPNKKTNDGYSMTEAQKKEHDALFGNHETEDERKKREHDALFTGRY